MTRLCPNCGEPIDGLVHPDGSARDVVEELGIPRQRCLIGQRYPELQDYQVIHL
jgi:hypothetical protein